MSEKIKTIFLGLLASFCLAVTMLILIIVGIGVFYESEPMPESDVVSTVVDTEPTPKPKPRPVLPLDQHKLIDLVNDEREKEGLSRLATSSLLNSAACQKLDHMLANDYWSHNSPDGITPWYFFDLVGYYYLDAGENLAYGHLTERSMVEGWMDSAGHRENILKGYAETGLCSKRGLFQGQVNNLVVQLFGTPQY